VRDLRIDELAHHREQVVERQQKCLAQRPRATASCAGVSVV
jgi:hypothetical protein